MIPNHGTVTFDSDANDTIYGAELHASKKQNNRPDRVIHASIDNTGERESTFTKQVGGEVRTYTGTSAERLAKVAMGQTLEKVNLFS